MPVSFQIKVTRQILEQSKYCGSDKDDLLVIGKNCAIAVALNGIFPDVLVNGHAIYPFGLDDETRNNLIIELPQSAKDFIKVFDSLAEVPILRALLPEFEFTIDIPDEIIAQINIDGLKKMLKKAGPKPA